MSRRFAGIAMTTGCLVAFAGCSEKPKAASPAKETPATVSKPAKEDDLGTVTLKPEAEKRLGLETATAKVQPIARAKTYPGDVMVPPGRLIIVSSPFAATVVGDAPPVVPGQPVKAGQTIVSLQPVLSADTRAQFANLKIEADGQVDQAKKQLNIAKVAVDRIQKLRSGSIAVGAGAVEDANNAFELAENALRIAEVRRDSLAKSMQQAGIGGLTMLPLISPADGILRNLQVQPGQQVAVGAPLFEVERLDPVWIRVPVYVGDLKVIAAEKDARVGSLADRGDEAKVVAKPVEAPPTGDPLSATVDLYYEVANPKFTYRPGQRLGVSVPLTGKSEGLVIPSSALYYDIQGGSWVYEKVKDHTFVRRRVEIERVADGTAVVTRGLKANVEVVTVAVPELYGTEFGFAK